MKGYSMVKQKDAPISSSTAPAQELRVWLRAGLQPAKEPLHEAFANMRDEPAAVEAFSKKWGPAVMPEEEAHPDWNLKITLAFRETLRRAWRGDNAALEMLHRHLSKSMAHVAVVDGRIELRTRELWTAAFLLFAQDYHAGKTGCCGNPDCAAPYFLKTRKTQKFCEAGACVSYAQRQYAMKWWNEEGKQQREQRRKKAQGRKH